MKFFKKLDYPGTPPFWLIFKYVLIYIHYQQNIYTPNIFSSSLFLSVSQYKKKLPSADFLNINFQDENHNCMSHIDNTSVKVKCMISLHMIYDIMSQF